MDRHKLFRSTKIGLAAATVAVFGGVGMYGGVSNAASLTNTNQQKLQTIIAKGDQEITRRLASLQTLSSKLASMSKLSLSDKAYLTTEVSNEQSGLTTLKVKLDGETSLGAARNDATDIFTEYRVYALVLPKTWLVKTSDDQQVAEDKLTALQQKLQNIVNTDNGKGKDVTALQAELNDMQTQITNARAISSTLELKVSPLQPSDYNSDHALLSGDASQLKQAHTDNKAALADAKKVEAGLKNL